MKLYTYTGAPNPRRVHIFLAEKGIEIPFEQVDIMKRENRTPEFIEKVNVMGGLPVLELDDGSHIAESVSICRYLEALNPEPSLFGATPKEQGVIDMWLRRVELNFMVPVGQVWIHGSPLTKAVNPNQIAEAAEFGRKTVGRYFEFLDGQLAKREFIAGDSYSMVDISALCTLDFGAALIKLVPDPGLENLSRWHQGVSARPSASA
jgi:glutathione S-transferase